MVLLAVWDHSCLSVATPIVPVTLIVNTLQFQYSTLRFISQSNILAIVLLLVFLRYEINSVIMYTLQHQLPPSRNSSKLTCLQKSIRHGLPCHPCVLLVWPGYVIGLMLITLLQVRSRVCQLMEIKCYKITH